MKKVLIGSPVHQKEAILNEFLISLEELEKKNLQVDYCFIDDNFDVNSSILLNEFKERNENVTILKPNEALKSIYICDDFTHIWSDELIEKVSRFKNNIIELAKKEGYDYLFFIDSDIILHPNTLNRLISDDKEIVANIFWTKWIPDAPESPQVWLKDEYTLYDSGSNRSLIGDEAKQKTEEFLDMLRKPGVYKVGGLGACTLISKSAILKGVNFDRIYNLSFWGEDRHFCIRAGALGIQLYVDTFYPAYHIYREIDLIGVKDYKEKCINREKEVLGDEILDVISAGVEGCNTYSYKEDINKEFMKYFMFEEATKCLEKLNKDRSIVLEEKIINRCKVFKRDISFNKDNTKIVANVKSVFEGYKNFYSFYELYNIVCTLSKQSDGKFLIDNIKIDKQLPIDKPKIIRKVSENPKLTLSMIIKNEEDRYLKEVLENCKEYIDSAVIIDDGSTDNGVRICKDILKGIPLKIIKNETSKFSNEIELRKQQWDETISTNPEWILFLDADEMFEDKAKYEIKEMIKDFDTDAYSFRLYDFWNETHYRADNFWYAHLTYRPFMIRYQENFKYEFIETPQHCGRMPRNIMQLPNKISNLRIKHYGWARESDRLNKYNRYMLLDPNGKYGSIRQYVSILDRNPKLTMWNENE
jgi:GT2 family glycosyltransferase